MQTYLSDNFRRTLSHLRRWNPHYFLQHPEDPQRQVKIISPDNGHTALLTLKNPYKQ